MFSNCPSDSAFSPSRFDANSIPPLIGMGGEERTKDDGILEAEARLPDTSNLAQRGGLGQRTGRQPFSTPANRWLEQALSADALPCGMLDRLHAWVDGLPDKPPTGTTAA